VHVRGGKGLLQNADGLFGFGIAAHEDVEGREIPFGPGMHADVGFCQDRYPGYASVWKKMVQVDVQKGCLAFMDAFTQCGFHDFQIVQVFGAPQVDDEVCSGEKDTVPFYEVVLSLANDIDLVVCRPIVGRRW